MRARWKNQFHYLEAQSKFHEALRQVFLTHPSFKQFNCYQEVPVQDLWPDYPTRSHSFDWYISELGCVIELHGIQHYKPVDFGGQGKDQAIINHRRGQFRDGLKYHACQQAQLLYIEIPYTDQKLLSGEYLLERIANAT